MTDWIQWYAGGPRHHSGDEDKDLQTGKMFFLIMEGCEWNTRMTPAGFIDYCISYRILNFVEEKSLFDFIFLDLNLNGCWRCWTSSVLERWEIERKGQEKAFQFRDSFAYKKCWENSNGVTERKIFTLQLNYWKKLLCPTARTLIFTLYHQNVVIITVLKLHSWHSITVNERLPLTAQEASSTWSASWLIL